MCTVYGYCRISTPKQNLERQERNILHFAPDAKLYKDTWTGRTTSRPNWNKLQKLVKSGDTIIFDSVSRMSRNAADGFQMYKELYEMGVNLVFLKERHIDTDSYKEALQGVISNKLDTEDTAVNDLVNTIMDAINTFMMHKVEMDIYKAFEQSEKEVEDLRQRTKEGVQTAILNGKQVGRVTGTKVTTKKEIAAKAVICKHSKDFGGTLSDPECMKLAGCSRNSYYKYKKELHADQLHDE